MRPRRVAFAIGWLTATLVAAAAYVVPVAMLRSATSDARACLATINLARGSALPDCSGLAAGFDVPARFPWTSKAAADRREELGARIAIARYVDAAVGDPDAAKLAEHVAALDVWRDEVSAGSGRLVLEELGHATGAPSRGQRAAALGDRKTLLEGYREWELWHVQRATLYAALLEGDLERATTVAAHYASTTPREDDLTTAVGAVLCLGERPGEGLPLLVEVIEHRAGTRREAMARHFGEVFTVAVACAARAGEPPPPLPSDGGAGVADAIETRAIQRARLASARRQDDALERALDLVTLLLQSEPRPEGLGLWPETPNARPHLLAAMLASDPSLTASRALDLSSPRSAREGTGAPTAPWTAAMVWDQPGSLLTPQVTVETLERAADRLRAMADELDDRRAGRERLRAAAADMYARLALLAATHGEAERAAAALGESAELGTDPPAMATQLAVAWRLSGEPTRALHALDAVATVEARGPRADAVKAALLLERAATLAALGRRSDAIGRSIDAEDAAYQARDPFLHHEARWVRIALAPRDDTRSRPAPDTWGPPPWVGYADRAARWLDPRNGAASRALDDWERALHASEAERRAFRYALLERRGDAPPMLVPYLFAASRLLESDAGDRASGAAVETWLDALIAHDLGAFTLREHAWSRAEAARWRGDAEDAKRWDDRLRVLRRLAADPMTTEIAAFLNL